MSSMVVLVSRPAFRYEGPRSTAYLSAKKKKNKIKNYGLRLDPVRMISGKLNSFSKVSHHNDVDRVAHSDKFNPELLLDPRASCLQIMRCLGMSWCLRRHIPRHPLFSAREASLIIRSSMDGACSPPCVCLAAGRSSSLTRPECPNGALLSIQRLVLARHCSPASIVFNELLKCVLGRLAACFRFQPRVELSPEITF